MRKPIYNPQSRIIGNILKGLREKSGLTQKELCRVLGKEHSFVSKYELGERRIDIAEFYRICAVCGANPETEAKKIVTADIVTQAGGVSPEFPAAPEADARSQSGSENTGGRVIGRSGLTTNCSRSPCIKKARWRSRQP